MKGSGLTPGFQLYKEWHHENAHRSFNHRLWLDELGRYPLYAGYGGLVSTFLYSQDERRRASLSQSTLTVTPYFGVISELAGPAENLQCLLRLAQYAVMGIQPAGGTGLHA